MSNFPQVQRINASQVVTVTPTVSTSPAYTSGDQLGGVMEIPFAVRQDGITMTGFTELVEVTILDASKQDAAIDIWLFNQSPTITSSANATIAMLNQLVPGTITTGPPYAYTINPDGTVTVGAPIAGAQK